MKKLYAIGTGPGDPELLTLKAVRLMREADLIFAVNNKGKNMALDTAAEFIKGKPVVYLDFPMGSVTEDTYRENIAVIYENIKEGGTGVFLTIGDATVYSTFMNTLKFNTYSDLDFETVPGIPSFIAGANRLKRPLCLKGERFLLLDGLDEDSLDCADSVAILKTSSDKERIIDSLQARGFDFKYISEISLEGEKILEDREEIIADKKYMSIIFGRKKS